MFYGCTSLNYVKCLAVNRVYTDDTVENWLAGVASSGTFVKNPNKQTWPRSSSGVPEGWTVVDATN